MLGNHYRLHNHRLVNTLNLCKYACRQHSGLTQVHSNRMEVLGVTTPGPSHEDRCVGTLLWKACADALGAAVEGWQAHAIAKAYPQGLVQYVESGERKKGHYTDDTQMALALARSIAEEGGVHPGQVSAAYAQDYEPWRGYGGTAHLILKALQTGEGDWQTIGRKHFPEGSFANGGAMRIAPVGLAFRHAPPAVLRAAVQDALVCTHVHPDAVDGAVVIAAAVAWLSKQAPAGLNHVPVTAGMQSGLVWSLRQQQFALALLGEVLTHSQVPAMREKLVQLQAMFAADLPVTASPAGPPVAPIPDVHTSPADGHTSPAALQHAWGPYLASEAWQQELSQVWSLSGEEFQIKAVDAVPQVLYAFCRHGCSQHPANAVIAAAHYGGDTDTIAAMVGALLGALYGCQGLPAVWVEELENGHALGRDGIVALGRVLAHVCVDAQCT